MYNKQLWEQSVDMIIKSIWIYTIAGILGATGEEGPTGAFGTLDIICQIAVIVGYVLFFLNIKKFVDAQPTEADRAAAKNVYTSYLFLIIATVVAFIPIVGGIAWLVLIILSYVKLLSGYKGLRESATLKTEAKNGANGDKHHTSCRRLPQRNHLSDNVLLRSSWLETDRPERT